MRIIVVVAAAAAVLPGPRPAAGATGPARDLTGPRTFAGVTGPLYAEQGQLYDETGRIVVLRGINAMDKVVGADGDLFPDLDTSDLDRIASIGFNVVRLGTSWAAIEPSPGVYDDAYIARFLTLMDDAHARGLRVIVDMHQDVWGEAMGGNGAPAWATPSCNVPPRAPLASTTGQWFAQYGSPDVQASFSNFWSDGAPDVFCTGNVQTRFVAMWGHLASRLAGHPALAGYDLLNEPWPGLPPGAFETLQLAPFHARVTAAIRASDPRTLIFYEPPIWKSGGVPAVPTGAPDHQAVYAPHIYTETMFSGGALTTDAATDTAVAIEDQYEGLLNGSPTWIGEWGAFENAASERYQRAFYDVMDRTHMGSAYWHYTQGYTDGLKARPPSADAGHIRVYPEAFFGAAVWTFDPGSRVFRMTQGVARPGTSTSSIVVPARLYPDGVVFEGDGTVVWDPVSGRAVWTVSAPGSFRLVVRPA